MFLNDVCCICISKSKELKSLSYCNADKITYYDKLTNCLSGMCFKEMNEQRKICKECADTLNIVYKFHQKCLRGKIILMKYISQQAGGIFNSKKSKEGNITTNTKNKKQKIQKNSNEIASVELNDNNNKSNKIHAKFSDKSYRISVKNISDLQTDFEDDNFDDSSSVSFVGDDEIDFDIADEPLPSLTIDFDENTSNDEEKKKQINYDNCEAGSSRETIPKVTIANNKKKQDINTSNNYTCDLCKTAFNDKNSFEKHMLTHGGMPLITPFKKLYTNNTRNKVFLQQSNEASKDPSTEIDKKIYTCNICSEEFNDSTDLSTHMKVHTDFSFNRSYSLHSSPLFTKKEPYECFICNKTFTEIRYLKNHIGIHTTIRQYECDVCKNTYRREDILKKHKRIHTGEKPFECELCDFKFRESRQLNDHRSVHKENVVRVTRNAHKRMTVKSMDSL